MFIKKSKSIIIILFCVTNLIAQEVTNNLNQQLLAVKEWNNSNGDSIRFNENGTLIFHEESEPVISGETNYTIESKMVLFKFKNSSDPRLKGREYKCNLKFKEHDYLPKQYIACEGKSKNVKAVNFYNPNSINPPDHKYEIQDQKVVSTKRTIGTVNSDVFFREKANVNSKFFAFNQLSSEECMGDRLRDLKSDSDISKQIKLPQGFSVEIIARTESMHKIEKWNNYWYFVSTSLGCYGGVTTTYGWIYGNFISF
ncbi:hypothetical protein LEP1GSC188_3163 [Leptospira weilii serovar Topaz str. LT2116]|uniref:SH3 domain protein n=1 Tax=Leptospira weilii serovar Topaz str. LT2116 TaxID=1088540 RepID=M3EIP7_9LEPT|nr:hypothetical protein LEP1GSC188_3163 [Leptospira weilii serovar Topaz str. LT2116]